jgi:hypothetical protein
MPLLSSLVRQGAESLGGHQALLLARFINKLPALWHQERCAAQYQGKEWNCIRFFVAGDKSYFPTCRPDDLDTAQGSYLQAYNAIRYLANALHMRRQVLNFIRHASKARHFADTESAEGFYRALFASMHGRNANILSINWGSTDGCNPKHNRIVREQNRQSFQPSHWDYLQDFVTDQELQNPNFQLPLETSIATLSELFLSAGCNPDLTRFDIESSEYESLLNSLDYLQENRPTLTIEAHKEILKQRQLTFKPVLKRLQDISYRVVAYNDPDYLKVGNCHVFLQCRS